MTLKKILLYPIENWMRPMMLSFISLPLLLLGMLANIELLNVVGGLFFLVNLMLLFISFIYLLLKKQWRKSMYTLIFIAIIAMILGLLN
jgi:predicted membrane channel-forming protein YqfA (hemolysin III family)